MDMLLDMGSVVGEGVADQETKANEDGNHKNNNFHPEDYYIDTDPLRASSSSSSILFYLLLLVAGLYWIQYRRIQSKERTTTTTTRTIPTEEERRALREQRAQLLGNNNNTKNRSSEHLQLPATASLAKQKTFTNQTLQEELHVSQPNPSTREVLLLPFPPVQQQHKEEDINNNKDPPPEVMVTQDKQELSSTPSSPNLTKPSCSMNDTDVAGNNAPRSAKNTPKTTTTSEKPERSSLDMDSSTSDHPIQGGGGKGGSDAASAASVSSVVPIAEQEPSSRSHTTTQKKRKHKESSGQILSDLASTLVGVPVQVQEGEVTYQTRKLGVLARTDGGGGGIWTMPCHGETKWNPPSSMHQAIQWHGQAMTIVRNRTFPPYVSYGDEGWTQVMEWIDSFRDVVATTVATWLEHDLNSVGGMKDDDYEEEDLFSEDYKATPKMLGSKLSEFYTLLGDSRHVLHKTFLDDLMSAHQKLFSTRLESVLIYELMDKSKSFVKKDGMGWTNALLTFITLVPDALTLLLERIREEIRLTEEESTTGKTASNEAWLETLFFLGAYTIPSAGAELPEDTEEYMFRDQLEALREFPLSAFGGIGNPDFEAVKINGRQTMGAARRVAETVLKKLAAKDKKTLFGWFRQIVRLNEGLTSILLSDLLSPDSMVAICSSRQFLLGGTVSLINLCCDSLTERLLKSGDEAFDVHYLKYHNAFHGGRCLVSSPTAAESLKCDGVQFTGSTEFFFVGSLMLRVSLYPCLRMKNETQQRYRNILKIIKNASEDRSTPLPTHIKTQGKNVVSAMVGWNAFMRDEMFVIPITKFALLQLQWLRAASRANHGSNLILIPEWLCKEPSLWITEAAHTFSHLLKPHQAEAAVECATELLQVGTKMNHADGASFSPIVVHDLVKIIVAFVHAGVHKAKVKQAHKGRSRRALHSNNQDATEEDDRHLNIYHSFDHDDLGVAVFTNQLVLTNLCPTLLQAFCALDVIEGLDVDREHGFDKFQAKGEIADLLLWLIGHPNGLCMQSIAQLPSQPLVRFAKSLSAAIGYIFDDALHRLSDVAGAAKNDSLDDFIESQSNLAASRLHMSRIYLLLLCKLSKQPNIARCVAGRADESAALDMATMLVHFIDKLTCTAGGTNPDLDPCLESSSQILAELPNLAEDDVSNKCFDLLRARQEWDATYGFDISIFCHQLFALATCWDRSVDASSGIIDALSANEDLDVNRLRNIYRRLIQEDMAMEDTSEAILRHDGLIRRYGYHRFKLLARREETDEEAQDHVKDMGLKQQARQDQMSHDDISLVASYDHINAFLNKLERRMEERNASYTNVTTTEVGRMEETILSGNSVLTEAQYCSNLSFWVISSEPFRSMHDESSFAHYYDAIARSGVMSCSGKAMVKEARRCHTTLPVPHPNSAAFCCFAEERMDLCRSIITGPVDTPYSLGIFIFDVFFPANYPSIAPLVTFMTTGGGQTRFNPNLYQDGKVCLSLLGTWHASDESQKWNPKVSSLAQVLLSIQTQLLVTEPYFNEPGYDQTKGTFAGREGSKRYNCVLRLATLRHAIIGYLREPPNGFAEVSKRHFSMSRKRIVVQAKRWMLEAKGTSLFGRFERAYADIITLLDTECMQSFPALPPLADDVEALMTLDSNFVALCRVQHVVDDEDDTKPAARQQEVAAHATTVGNGETGMPNVAAGVVEGSGGTFTNIIHSHVSDPDEAAIVTPTSNANFYNPWADPNSYANVITGQVTGPTSDYDSDGSLYL